MRLQNEQVTKRMKFPKCSFKNTCGKKFLGQALKLDQETFFIQMTMLMTIIRTTMMSSASFPDNFSLLEETSCRYQVSLMYPYDYRTLRMHCNILN